MKKVIYTLLLSFFQIFSNAQILTTYPNSKPTSSNDGSHTWNIVKIDLYQNYVLIQCEITALKPIRRLNIDSNDGRIIWGNESGAEKLHLKGIYEDGKIKEFNYNKSWGWNKISRGDKVIYTLYFGGGGYYGNTIPSGITTISVYGIEVDVNGYKTTWKCTNININNPRKNYTDIYGEYSAKQKIDETNDGICGIYEEIGGENNHTLACIKEFGEYKLVYLSSSNDVYGCWQVGDIKANLRQSALGVFKADWFMEDKMINNDCYIIFDGLTMTITLSDKEKKHLKMYPTNSSLNSNSEEENKEEQMPQRRQSIPQQRKIPQLKKQNVK